MPSPHHASVLFLALFAAGCAGAAETPRREISPGKERKLEAPARVVVVRTDRFLLRASAYVELYVELLHEQADRDTAMRLLACEDDACAMAVYGSTPHAEELVRALPGYLRERWRDDVGRARAAIDRALPWLFAHEDAVARRVATDLAIVWPPEPIVLAVTTRGGARWARSGAMGAAGAMGASVDLEAGCFDHAAILECAFREAAHQAAPRLASPVIAASVFPRSVTATIPAYVPFRAERAP